MSYIIIQSFNANPMQQAIEQAFDSVRDEIQVDAVIQLNDNLYSVLYTTLNDIEESDFCFMVSCAVKRNSDLAVFEIALPIENEIWDHRYQEELNKRLVT